MLALNKTGGQCKVVKSSVHFALMEGGGDGNGSVDFDTRRPETVVEVYLCEGYFLNRRNRLFRSATHCKRQ